MSISSLNCIEIAPFLTFKEERDREIVLLELYLIKYSHYFNVFQQYSNCLPETMREREKERETQREGQREREREGETEREIDRERGREREREGEKREREREGEKREREREGKKRERDIVRRRENINYST